MFKNSKLLSGLLCIVAAIITAIAYWLQPAWFQPFIELLKYLHDIDAMIAYIRSYGPYAMLISFFLIVFINMAAILPNIFVLAANGIVFGIVEGTLI